LLSNLIFKIEKSRINKVVDHLKEFNDIDLSMPGINSFLQIQSAVLLSKKGEFDDILQIIDKLLDITKYIPVRVFSSAHDYYFIKYSRSFIHIPKTGGRHLIYKYFVFQDGGNHLFASTRSPNHNQYCEDFSRCFAVVRNPFGWLYSYWANKSDEGPAVGCNKCRSLPINDTFENFIFNVCNLSEDIVWFPYNSGMTSQIFDVKDRICASDIMYFERYQEGISLLHLEEKTEPFLTGEIRTESHMRFLEFKKSTADHRLYYTTKMIDAVNEKFKFDLDFLGYNFDGLTHQKDLLHIDKQMTRKELLML